MKEIIGNLFGFLYTLSMGDYIFFSLTFILILLFIYMLFLIKREDINDNNLESIVKSIETEYKPNNITLTDYETEQEKNAIISYDELIKNKNQMNINYDEEYTSNTEEISIKKISFNETNLKEEAKKIDIKLMSYEKEEEFLITLKQLQQNLLN